MLRRIKIRPVLALFAVLCWCCAGAKAEPRNMVLFIGDGMGFEQVKAARFYLGEPLLFEWFPYQGEVQTYSASSSVTDSAAAATAMATGHKVNNGVISMQIPGAGTELTTLLEQASAAGKSTGLVTTAYLTHATPAAFAAHEESRSNVEQIAGDYLDQTLPNLLFGGGGNGLTGESATAAGYAVALDADGFDALDAAQPYLCALFGVGHLPYKYTYLDGGYPYPTLAELTAKALDALDRSADGFFLMVEGGRIDHACHSNLLEPAIHETLDFADAVQTAVAWADGRADTLIVVTADHETGGLSVEMDQGQFNYPSVQWSTTGHTGVNVPIYAWGPNAKYFSGLMDNAEIVDATLADDDPPSVSFDPAAQSGDEGTQQLLVDVRLSALSSLDVVVPFTVSGTASGGGIDYQVTDSPVTIAAGEMSVQIVIEPSADYLAEEDETVILTMGYPSHAWKGDVSTHVATIYDRFVCPECSGTSPSLEQFVFRGGYQCTCRGTESLTIGPGVEVEANASATLVAPTVRIQSGVVFRSGASVRIGR